MGCQKLDIVSKNNTALKVVHRRYSESGKVDGNYYPFGMQWDTPLIDKLGNSLKPSGQKTKYTYNGKEIIDDLGLNLHDYGARLYDPAIARWNAPDPLAERYSSLSSFTYVANSPVNAIDPDGNKIIILNKLKTTMRNLAIIASTKKGAVRLNALIANRRSYGVSSVFWTNNSGYDQAGHLGRKHSIYYASSPWRPRVGKGGVSGSVILGHEMDHAYRQQGGRMNTTNLESLGVKFGNYLRSVLDKGPMRTKFPLYGLKFSSDESKYNSTGESVSNFTDSFDKTTEGGDQYLGFTYDYSDGGESSKGYILSVTTEDGTFAYRKFTNKKEYNTAVKRVEELKNKK